MVQDVVPYSSEVPEDDHLDFIGLQASRGGQPGAKGVFPFRKHEDGPLLPELCDNRPLWAEERWKL
jgi:hypothetical protein